MRGYEEPGATSLRYTSSEPDALAAGSTVIYHAEDCW